MLVKLFKNEAYPVYEFDGNPLESMECSVNEKDFCRWQVIIDLYIQVQTEMRQAWEWQEGRNAVALNEEETGDMDV